MEEPGRLQSMGLLGVGHDWATSLSLFTFMHWRRTWQPTPVFLPGESQGWGSLVCCSPWGRKEFDTTERLHFHYSLSCIGEGNGNPLQCSCLENPKDGGACWAAVCGVAQNRTRLKWLSSSSSSSSSIFLFHLGLIASVWNLTDLKQGIFKKNLYKLYSEWWRPRWHQAWLPHSEFQLLQASSFLFPSSSSVCINLILFW